VRRAQPQPHGNFGGEVALLRERLGALGALGSAYVLGDALNGLQWHVFVADAGAAAGAPPPPVYTLEICMTHLCPAKVRVVAAGRGSPTACAAAALHACTGSAPCCSGSLLLGCLLRCGAACDVPPLTVWCCM